MVRLALPARRVLAFLALHESGPHQSAVPRGAAAEQLWPDVPEPHGRANLRRALWQLPHGWVESVGEDLVLDAEVDLHRARAVAAACLGGRHATLEEIALLSEDLLPGWHEEWATAAQDSFRQLRLQALEAVCRTMAGAGQHALATQAGIAALAAEPLSESAAEALIAAHLSQGNRYAALRCYRDFRRLLWDELGVDPAPALVARLTHVSGTHKSPLERFGYT
ncbi:AfsR/SARP family transcriptional regulator [Sinomonas halotolerans]|uniref:BTAD domain-containing putative transcriptional regulator n=1 Tax=Sinomonas halotolerans TaxID=1644133 RepID=A0ABU9WYH8_9MICC